MKEKRDNHSVKDVTSNYHIDQVGKEISPETRQKLNKNIVEARKKELELLNTIGSDSVVERHYPKSFFIKKEEE